MNERNDPLWKENGRKSHEYVKERNFSSKADKVGRKEGEKEHDRNDTQEKIENVE